MIIAPGHIIICMAAHAAMQIIMCPGANVQPCRLLCAPAQLSDQPAQADQRRF